jgi:hypothetical protein
MPIKKYTYIISPSNGSNEAGLELYSEFAPSRFNLHDIEFVKISFPVGEDLISASLCFMGNAHQERSLNVIREYDNMADAMLLFADLAMDRDALEEEIISRLAAYDNPLKVIVPVLKYGTAPKTSLEALRVFSHKRYMLHPWIINLTDRENIIINLAKLTEKICVHFKAPLSLAPSILSNFTSPGEPATPMLAAKTAASAGAKTSVEYHPGPHSE